MDIKKQFIRYVSQNMLGMLVCPCIFLQILILYQKQ